jgi:hypothetical protein
VSKTTELLAPPDTVGASNHKRRWRGMALAVTAVVVLATAGVVAWLSDGDSGDETTSATAPSTAPPAIGK